MGEKTTLRDVLDYHKRMAAVAAMDKRRLDVMRKHGAMADAIDANLTQPAQSVDVEAIREVIESHINEAKKLRHDPELQDYLYEHIDKLEAALQEKGNGA